MNPLLAPISSHKAGNPDTEKSRDLPRSLTAGKGQNRDPTPAGQDRAVGCRVYVLLSTETLSPPALRSEAEICSQQGSESVTSG